MLAAIANWLHRRRLVPAGWRQWSFGETLGWLVSFVIHLSALIALGWVSFVLPAKTPLVLSLNEANSVDPPQPLEFEFSPVPSERVGALGDSATSLTSARPAAPFAAEESEIVFPIDPSATGARTPTLDFDRSIFTGPVLAADLFVKGAGSVGTSAAEGAIDRLTHEILLSLDERPTLVVWLFDQSRSLAAERESITKRFDHVYHELGVIKASGNKAFGQHEERQPLLTAVGAFGAGVHLLTAKPTDDVAGIKAAVRSVEDDVAGKGRENVFQSVGFMAEKFRHYRTGSHRRNVMIIVFTDEAGDDLDHLDAVVDICRKFEMPVFVIGVPAPFGRDSAYVKWVDPDPAFDQTPQRQVVHQGPETMLPERVKLVFGGRETDEEQIDSGFGPFGLCRLAYESGGLYSTVHPNREAGRRIAPWETAAMSTYLSAFFDPRVMRNYRPDYVSAKQYRDILESNRACAVLTQVGQLPWITVGNVRLRFPRIDDATFARDLSTAQRDAARVEPEINQLVALLRQGEKDRDELTSPRWQAGYDLAMGQALAFKVRTESYNMLLAQAKQGLKFQNESNDTWQLVPIATADISTALAKDATAARTYLERVVTEHPGTPWAYDAERELSLPMSWRWQEAFSNVAALLANAEQNGPRPQPQLRPPAKPRRDPPDL
jgi:hypothetical protein